MANTDKAASDTSRLRKVAMECPRGAWPDGPQPDMVRAVNAWNAEITPAVVLSLLDRIEELERILRIAWQVSDENATAAGNAPSHE